MKPRLVTMQGGASLFILESSSPRKRQEICEMKFSQMLEHALIQRYDNVS
jgi:hypothetical protein